MAQLSQGNFTTIADKLARFAGEAIGDVALSGSFNAGFLKAWTDVLNGAGGIDTFILTLGDLQQEADLLPAALALDEKPPVIGSTVLLAIPEITAFFSALDKHFKRFGFASTDAWLTSLNGATGMTPTLRVHGFLKNYFGKYTAHNNFIPKDLVICTFIASGATTGARAAVASINKTLYAGAKLVVKNVGALNSTTAVSVTGKKLDGTTQVITASVSVLTDAHETDLTSTSKVFTDVTAISVTGATNLDEFEIVAKSDRSVASA